MVAWLDITAVRVDRDGPVRLAFSTRSYCGSPSDLDVVSLAYTVRGSGWVWVWVWPHDDGEQEHPSSSTNWIRTPRGPDQVRGQNQLTS